MSKKELTVKDIKVSELKKMVEALNDVEDLLDEPIKMKKMDDEEIFDAFVEAVGDIPDKKEDDIPEEVTAFYNKILKGKKTDDDDDEPKKKKKKDKNEEEEEEPKKKKKSDELTAEELLDMDEKEMKKLIKKQELDVDASDFDDDEKGLREAIAEELDIDLPKKKKKAKDEEEEEEEPKKKKKSKDEDDDEEPKKKKKSKDDDDEDGDNPFGFKKDSNKAFISDLFVEEIDLHTAAKKVEKKLEREGMRAYSTVLNMVKKLIKMGHKVVCTISATPKKSKK